MFSFSQYRSQFRYKYYLTGFVVDTDCVFCDVRTENLYTIQLKLVLKIKIFIIILYIAYLKLRFS
jgi:hypothetical protein